MGSIILLHLLWLRGHWSWGPRVSVMASPSDTVKDKWWILEVLVGHAAENIKGRPMCIVKQYH